MIGLDDPHEAALAFVRSAARHGCSLCRWDPELARTIEGDPPPVT